jgi:hypothetical protein
LLELRDEYVKDRTIIRGAFVPLKREMQLLSS